MQDNIQVPVKVDIRKLVENYGSHFVIDFNDEKINEVIGEKDRLNHWEHQNATLEIAKQKMLNKLEILKREERASYLDVISPLTWRLVSIFLALKIPHKNLKANVKKYKDNIAAVEAEIEKLKAGDYPLEVNMLNGEYNIPKYMPEAGQTYFHLKMYHLDNVKIENVILESSDIYDYRGCRSCDAFSDQFDFKFNFTLTGENSQVYIDSERLIQFNGKFWKLSGQGEYLFLDKKEALLFVKNAVDMKIDALEKSKKDIDAQIEAITV